METVSRNSETKPKNADHLREFTANPHRAGARTTLAELGSLAVEFTRLAQITKDMRYYDAIARITDELETWQNDTQIPGLWPLTVDASGCKKPIALEDYQAQFSPGASGKVLKDGTKNRTSQIVEENDHRSSSSNSGKTSSILDDTDDVSDWKGSISGKDKQNESKASDTLERRQIAIDELSEANVPSASPGASSHSRQSHRKDTQTMMSDADVECIAQGLATPPNTHSEEFSLGGRADSLYEYLPKQYLLLGGLAPQYRSMYESAVSAATRHLLKRPLLPNDPDILVLGTAHTRSSTDASTNFTITLEQQHLLCFSGGMYALGAKVFGRDDDLDIAAKITDGCVWSYKSTKPTGIMPEGFTMTACENPSDCQWSESKWDQAYQLEVLKAQENRRAWKRSEDWVQVDRLSRRWSENLDAVSAEIELPESKLKRRQLEIHEPASKVAKDDGKNAPAEASQVDEDDAEDFQTALKNTKSKQKAFADDIEPPDTFAGKPSSQTEASSTVTTAESVEEISEDEDVVEIFSPSGTRKAAPHYAASKTVPSDLVAPNSSEKVEAGMPKGIVSVASSKYILR